MSDEATPLTLPPRLSWPIRVRRICAQGGDEVQRGTRLLEYSFTSATTRKLLASAEVQGQDTRIKEYDMVGSWESPVEGKLERWAKHVEVGMVIDARSARQPVTFVLQPCTHPVQLHGMCGVCGQELAETDYLAPPAEETLAGPSRFPGSYEMGHDSLGVTVSHSEAERLDGQSRTNLLSSRKLSLIVDLDQTIIHTTVDPTVGEWLDEIKAAHRDGIEGVNPNEAALKDVASFQLEDEVPPGWNKAPDRTYYTKPRPGLPKFMEEMSRLYEMHVYTMGTRTYADAIVKAVDPEGRYFGGRILSRDESGSLSAKSLKRLFPTDQSMVVIIDDRSDVWSDVPNLVKVVPYEFFLGAGDINSAFLPPVDKNGAPSMLKLSTPGADPTNSIADAISEQDSLTRKAKLLDKLSEERPLQKMQEEMDKAEAEGSTEAGADAGMPSPSSLDEELPGAVDSGANENESAMAVTGSSSIEQGETFGEAQKGGTTTPPSSPDPKRRPLLKADDGELQRISSILRRVHRKYYAAFDAWDKEVDKDVPDDCDAPFILTEMKSEVLEGCHVVFSGIIPMNQRPETSHYWQLAETFGAMPSDTITRQTTHCIAATPGTAKVHQATKSGLFLVYPDWLSKSAAFWRRMEEGEYAMRPPAVEGDKGNGSRTRTPPALDTPDVGRIAQKTDETVAQVRSTENRLGMDESRFDDANAGKQATTFDGIENGLAGMDGGDDDWDKWMKDELGDGWQDDASERESRRASPSPAPSSPGTPRKRVRYADQEDLPLASFHQAPSKGNSGDDWSGDGGDSPPRKRKVPILLGPPSAGDEITNRIELSDKAKAIMMQQVEAADRVEEGQSNGADAGGEESSAGDAEELEDEEDEEDDFAKMLAESMAQ